MKLDIKRENCIAAARREGDAEVGVGLPTRFDKVADVPTEMLATRFVGMLIMAKGDINKWQAASEMLIRELRGEPQ